MHQTFWHFIHRSVIITPTIEATDGGSWLFSIRLKIWWIQFSTVSFAAPFGVSTLPVAFCGLQNLSKPWKRLLTQDLLFKRFSFSNSGHRFRAFTVIITVCTFTILPLFWCLLRNFGQVCRSIDLILRMQNFLCILRIFFALNGFH